MLLLITAMLDLKMWPVMFCTGRKLKAVKSCLVCLISYCEKHLQPHLELPAFEKHKLVDPSKKLQENICSRHDGLMKMFCRTDQKCICYLCLMEEHKGHDTVSAAIRKGLRGRESSRPSIALLIKQWRTAKKIFSQLIRLIQKRSSDVKQQLRSQQETEVSRVKELQEKLEQEITELKRKDADLKQLSHTEDHTQFLHNYPSLSALSQSTDSSSIKIRPLRYFEDVTAAVSEVRDKLQDVLTEKWTNISLTVTEVDVLLPQPEPKTRAEFFKYSPSSETMTLLHRVQTTFTQPLYAGLWFPYASGVTAEFCHDTVSAAAERTERQRELEVSRQNIQQRIQDREKDVKELQQEVEAINRSADKAVEDSEQDLQPADPSHPEKKL
ncbi:hypothetical protein L3Q82_021195 [Scortum barcoo]|uniref:Uncharacterized protein n=1 Tax=Scortum barcoo TaxID=214431 RepID=A0ACB8X4I1_9TELE|nr:hypothetical protein L3Q82_021195 [Scortum barcoo]